MNRISVVNLSKKVQKRREVIDGAISRVLDSGRFILDSEVAGFETKFAKYIGAGYCLGVANGSDAIELALRSSGITTNSIVGTVANAVNYSSGAISRIGATPVGSVQRRALGAGDAGPAAELACHAGGRSRQRTAADGPARRAERAPPGMTNTLCAHRHCGATTGLRIVFASG